MKQRIGPDFRAGVVRGVVESATKRRIAPLFLAGAVRGVVEFVR